MRGFSLTELTLPSRGLVYHAWSEIQLGKRFEIRPDTRLISLVTPYDEQGNLFASYRGWWDRLLSQSQFHVKLRGRCFHRKLKVGLEGAIDDRSHERATSYGRWVRANSGSTSR